MQQELDAAKKELSRSKESLKAEMERAKIDIRKSKDELQSYKEMITRMESDGLLNTKEDYSIDFKEGELYINNKQQPEKILEKFRPYFKNRELRIQMEKGNLTISDNIK